MVIENIKQWPVTFDKNKFNSDSWVIWYSITWEGSGSFKTFSTIYLPSLGDGSFDHSYWKINLINFK